MIYRYLTVDNKCDNKITEIITQREHGVTLFEIKCLNNGYDIDLTECTQAQFYGEKPDNHKVGVKCDFNEDKTAVLLPLILQMTTAKGLLNGALELSFEGGNIRFSGINFKVLPAPDDVEVESKDEFTIFENCLFKPEQDGKIGQALTLGADGKNVWSDVQGGSGGSFDYNDLENRPSINGVKLVGDKSLADLNIKQDYTADDISFSDGDTFQQKYDKGELKGQDGHTPKRGVDYFTDEDKTNFTAKITNNLEPMFDQKQDILVSGENIKTVNGNSLIGGGDLSVSAESNTWEKIVDFTLEEDVSCIHFDFEKPFKVKELLFIYYFGSSRSKNNTYVNLCISNVRNSGYSVANVASGIPKAIIKNRYSSVFLKRFDTNVYLTASIPHSPIETNMNTFRGLMTGKTNSTYSLADEWNQINIFVQNNTEDLLISGDHMDVYVIKE